MQDYLEEQNYLVTPLQQDWIQPPSWKGDDGDAMHVNNRARHSGIGWGKAGFKPSQKICLST